MIEKLIGAIQLLLALVTTTAGVLFGTVLLFAKIEKTAINEARAGIVALIACFVGDVLVWILFWSIHDLLGKFIAALTVQFVVAVVAAKLIFSPPISTRVFIGIVYSALVTTLIFGLFALFFAL